MPIHIKRVQNTKSERKTESIVKVLMSSARLRREITNAFQKNHERVKHSRWEFRNLEVQRWRNATEQKLIDKARSKLKRVRKADKERVKKGEKPKQYKIRNFKVVEVTESEEKNFP